MKGLIKSVLFHDSEIIAGTQAILLKEGDLFRGVVTVMHLLPSGEWYVSSAFYNGPVNSIHSLHRLVIEDSEGHQYPLVNKQWNSACQLNQINSGIEIEFDKRLYDFKEGFYEKPCKECESYFTGDKRQSLCQACCNDRTEAIITTSPKTSRETSNNTAIKQTSRIAFEAARENPTQNFDDWFNTKY